MAGRELRVNAGVRYSKTETDIDNFKQQGASLAYAPNQEEGSYSNVLPSVSEALDLTDTLMWRASWGKTISRASLGIIAAQTVIPNPFDNTATAGNPMAVKIVEGLRRGERVEFDTQMLMGAAVAWLGQPPGP